MVELMVVVLVLGTLIGMAIPSILTVRKAGNEVATIASLRTLSGAQSVHLNRFGVYGSIDDLVTRRLVDPTYQSIPRRGYNLVAAIGGSNSWSVNADPDRPGSSGDRFFFLDESGVIRSSLSGTAGASDTAID